MALLHYITHPEVAVDPSLPVQRWSLSPSGVERARALLSEPWVAGIGRVVSSAETKAREAAEILADHLGLTVEVRDDTGENDRTATGFLPPDEFERTADRFFARPEESVAGWERAVDAQARITAALADLLEPSEVGDVAVVGHGAVGTLWYCRLAGLEISRRHDQPGQGHYFTVDLHDGRPLHPWKPIAPAR